MVNKIKDKIVRNRIITLLYIVSTLFFIYQHSTGVSWDFTVYVLNAKYLFSNGLYFEWERPPLISFLFGIFSIFGWLATEYLYIVFTSSLFLFSSMKLSEKLRIDKTMFYSLLLSPFVLNLGLSVGTELLFLSLLQLFLAYLHEKKSGVFLSLAVLTHYTNLIYIILVLFQKNLKKIILSGFLFLIILMPWFLFNLHLTNNPLTSIANSFALNVKFRDYMFQSFNVLDILIVVGWYVPFFLSGLFLSFRKFKEKDFLMVSLIILILISYYKTPLKTPRYLFVLTIPITYFSTISLSKIKNKQIVIFILIIINFTLALKFLIVLDNPLPYKQVIPKLDDCMLQSNVWPYFNYYGIPTAPYPWKNSLDSQLQKGNRILLFKHVVEPEYVKDGKFLKKFPIIENTTEFILLGYEHKCASQNKVNESYLERLNRETGLKISVCEVFLPEKLCLIINKINNKR